MLCWKYLFLLKSSLLKVFKNTNFWSEYTEGWIMGKKQIKQWKKNHKIIKTLSSKITSTPCFFAFPEHRLLTLVSFPTYLNVKYSLSRWTGLRNCWNCFWFARFHRYYDAPYDTSCTRTKFCCVFEKISNDARNSLFQMRSQSVVQKKKR